MSRPLQVIADERGSVVVGFLSANVYYLRFIDHISSALGIRCASQLRRDLADLTDVTCLFDVASTDGGDFGARSAVVRALLATRSRLADVKTLVSSGSWAAKARALVTIPGSAAHLIDDEAAFQEEMFKTAPLSRTKLPASRWVPAVRSMYPSARSLRPRARTGTHC